MEIKELAFALTQHADDLQMFANGVSMDALDDFLQTEDAIMELIYKLYQAYEKKGLNLEPETKKYLENLLEKIAEIRENCFHDQEDELEKSAAGMIRNESKFLKAFFIALTGQSVIALNTDWFKRIAENGIYNGGTLKQIFQQLALDDVSRIYRAMIDALRNGKSLNEARKDVQKVLDRTRRNLDSEINSILNGIANDVAKAFAAENKTKLMFSTALDNNVCDHCNPLHGHIYNYDDPEIPAVPLHINCRCRLIPVPDDNPRWHGLDMRFSEYYSKLSSKQQIERIGRDKYELIKQDEYDVLEYEVPMPEQRINLAELRERDKKLFTKTNTNKTKA